MAKQPSPKTDQMRAMREARIKEAEERAKSRPVDNRVNEASKADPNGRGGKTKIAVPKRETKVKADRDRFPVPDGKRAPKRPTEPEPEAGKCSVCGRTRALVDGVLVSHRGAGAGIAGQNSCPGSGKGPRVQVAK